MVAQTKKCPMCAEEIPVNAQVCLYCNTPLGGKPTSPEAHPLPQTIQPAIKPKRTGLAIGLIAASLLLGCIACGAGLWFFRDSLAEALASVGVALPAQTSAYPMADGNAMGDPNAPVVIEEYSDFQCHYCALFVEETLPQIIDDYIATGKVYYIFHTLGSYLGPESGAAAEAAYCAADQNRFWEYHDILFVNMGDVNSGVFTDAKLLAFAYTLDLNIDQFQECYSGDKYLGRVNLDLLEVQQKNIAGAPTFYVNGQIINGAKDFSVFQTIIEAALDAASGD
ncbi:MAG: thioredoxin domain-containing protein [Chloroflexi bacterium]|nr:thioredoxin domain-containing protein [Chloroflexota bacterium]